MLAFTSQHYSIKHSNHYLKGIPSVNAVRNILPNTQRKAPTTLAKDQHLLATLSLFFEWLDAMPHILFCFCLHMGLVLVFLWSLGCESILSNGVWTFIMGVCAFYAQYTARVSEAVAKRATGLTKAVTCACLKVSALPSLALLILCSAGMAKSSNMTPAEDDRSYPRFLWVRQGLLCAVFTYISWDYVCKFHIK